MNQRNPLLFVALNLCLGISALGQQFMTREGHVHFFSSTPIENIEADNHQMSGLLDAATGEFAFQVQMRGFHFEKALMEEHFNESYVESDKHPKRRFWAKSKTGAMRCLTERLERLWPKDRSTFTSRATRGHFWRTAMDRGVVGAFRPV